MLARLETSFPEGGNLTTDATRFVHTCRLADFVVLQFGPQVLGKSRLSRSWRSDQGKYPGIGVLSDISVQLAAYLIKQRITRLKRVEESELLLVIERQHLLARERTVAKSILD